MYPLSSSVWVGVLTMKTSQYWAPVHQSSHQFLIVKMMIDFCHSFGIFIGPKSDHCLELSLSQWPCSFLFKLLDLSRFIVYLNLYYYTLQNANMLRFRHLHKS